MTSQPSAKSSERREMRTTCTAYAAQENNSSRRESVILERVDEIRRDAPRVGTRKLKDRLGKLRFDIARDKLFSLLREKGRLVKRKKRSTKTTG